MENKTLMKLNSFINQAYDCFSFTDFLKLSVLNLHEYVMYDSGMFFCSISKDCSFFKPYIIGPIEEFYKKKKFSEREAYKENADVNPIGFEAYVYKSADYSHGIVRINDEPRSDFLIAQEDFHIACLRIVYKGQFMGEIYLHRSRDKSDFSDEDMFVLRLLQPHISTVFNIIHTLTAVKYLGTSSKPDQTIGICMFDNDMSLIGGNVTGVEMLKAVTVFGSSALYHIKELCVDCLSESNNKNSSGITKTSLLKTPNGDIKVYILINKELGMNRKMQFVVTMQYCGEGQITADYKLKFTKREADIIDGLIQGKNNTRLAEALNISENTIKTHIKSIYKKTGANNRTELTYVLMLNRG